MEAFELRLWDSRLGRWLTTDPYREFSSPYLGMGNNPISLTDPDGGCVFCGPDLYNFIQDLNFYHGPGGFNNSEMLGEVLVGGQRIDVSSSENFIAAFAVAGGTISTTNSLYQMRIDQFLRNNSNFVQEYVPTQLEDITTFRPQDFDEYVKISKNPKSVRVVDVAGRSQIRTLGRAVSGAGYAFGVIGIGYSVNDYINGDIDELTLGLDIGFTVIGYAGLYGFGFSTTYFLLRAGLGNPTHASVYINDPVHMRSVRVDNVKVHSNVHKINISN